MKVIGMLLGIVGLAVLIVSPATGIVLMILGAMCFYVGGQHQKNSYQAQVKTEKQSLRAKEQAKREFEAERHNHQ